MLFPKGMNRDIGAGKAAAAKNPTQWHRDLDTKRQAGNKLFHLLRSFHDNIGKCFHSKRATPRCGPGAAHIRKITPISHPTESKSDRVRRSCHRQRRLTKSSVSQLCFQSVFSTRSPTYILTVMFLLFSAVIRSGIND